MRHHPVHCCISIFFCLLAGQFTQADFKVVLYRSGSPIPNLSAAEALITGQDLIEVVSGCAATINYDDDTGNVFRFPNGVPFPEGFVHSFAARVETRIIVSSTGQYTIGVNAGDGVRVVLDGMIIIETPDSRSSGNDLAVLNLTAGEHAIEITYFAALGGAKLELFSAPGIKQEFDDDFRLVGDTANGGFATVPTDPAQCGVSADASEAERSALIDLFLETGGEGWTNSTGWRDEPTRSDGFNENPCSPPVWSGVTCTTEIGVTRVNLSQRDLVGFVPDTIGDLTNLVDLNLSQNRLSGPIPGQIANLSSLLSLQLNRNTLSGTIPPELMNLSNLEVLNLARNNLEGPIPTGLGNLTRLRSLLLASNRFTGSMPLAIANLNELRVLNLSTNFLTGPIPVEFESLGNLTTFLAGFNGLTGSIPAELGNLVNLEEIELASNRLSGPIPSELGNLPNLSRLTLSSNMLSGSIPTVLGDLSELMSLALGSNHLEGEIPPELGNLTKLSSLALDGNRLSGPIPPQLGQLTRLLNLNLFSNQLTGAIPSELGQLVVLESLFLDQNSLEGPLPESLGQLANLIEFSVPYNRISGPLPAAFGNLSSLEVLRLQVNQISGPVPPELGMLPNLRSALLRHNWFNGEIPETLAIPPDLQILSLSGNALTGSVPSALSALPRGVLDLRNNNLLTVEGGLSEELNQAQAGQVDWMASQRTAAVYPQLAVGGGFEAVVSISNLSSIPWVGRGLLNAGEWPEDATWTLDGEDQTGRSDFEIELGSFETRKFVIGGGEQATAGWLLIGAEVRSSPNQVATAFFFNLSAEEGLIDSTGVDSSQLDSFQVFPVERASGGVDTGVAVRNVANQVRFILYDAQGRRVGAAALLSGDGARVISDIFPDIPDDFLGFVQLQTSDYPFYATALRFEIDRNGGIQLTSAPTITRTRRFDLR